MTRTNRSGRVARCAAVIALAITSLPFAAGAQSDVDGVATITGGITLTADDLATYAEPYVLLSDLSVVGAPGAASEDGTAEPDADPDGEIPVTAIPPVSSQVVAGLASDGGSDYEFALSLPVLPLGTPYSVTGDDGDVQPQVYSVDIVYNMAGDPFITTPDTYENVPQLASSLGFDADERLVGRLAVWSSGNGEQFPTGVGEDGAPLTADDPMAELDAGWTLVDLFDDEYEFIRDAEVTVGFPGSFGADRDFSGESWTDAFTALIDELERVYPFTDYKGINFDALRDEYLPRVEEAEADEDLDAYTLAVYEFGLEFGDGHVSSTLPLDYFRENYLAGYGLTLGEADGTVYVVTVEDGGSAGDEGIEPGDVVTEWGGEPIADALQAVPLALSASADFARDAQRLRLLTRAPQGESVEVTVQGADGDDRTVELEAQSDPTGFFAAVTPPNAGNDAAMPIESRVTDDGIGVIRINTFATGINLFTQQWDYAVRTLQSFDVSGVIIDVRANGGGLARLAFYASATFIEEPFILDTGYAANDDGEFEEVVDEVVPAGPAFWDVPVAVLVDSDCASSCEQFAASMSLADNDDISIIGETPSGGIYAAITSWELPEGLAFQAPYIRYEVDGEIFLEGQGVEPDVVVPVTEDSLLSPEDEVLEAGEEAVS